MKTITHRIDEFLLASSLVLIACGQPVPYEDYQYHLCGSGSVSIGIEDICILPQGNLLYITNPDLDKVYVMATDGLSVIDTVTIEDPRGICSLPSGDRVYVASSSGNSVCAIRTSDNSIEATIPVGELPVGICALPSGEYIYVANSGDSSISVIRALDNQVMGMIALEIEPLAICSDNLGQYVYCAGIDPESTEPFDSRLQVIQVSDNTLLPSNESLGAVCPGICFVFWAQSNMLYVVDYSDGLLMECATNTPPLHGATDRVSVGNAPFDVCTRPDGIIAFVTNSQDNTVSIVGLTFLELIETISTGDCPQGICSDPTGDRVYVACSGSGEVLMLHRHED
jgi:YVTN family beta-propeller protein